MNKNKRYVGQFDQLPPKDAQEQLTFLRPYGMVYFWMHVFTSTLLCTLLWTKTSASTTLLACWYASIVLLAICCWVSRSQFAKSDRMTQGQLNELIQRYRLCNMLLCTMWGISGIILFCEDTIGQAIHAGLLMMIALSVLPMSIISQKEFHTQLALLLLPIALMFALQNDLKTNLLSMVMLAFAAIAALVARIFTKLLNHIADAREALLEQIHTDPITQLVNRSHFDQTFKTEWRRSAREGLSLSLLLIEVDHFQQIELKAGNQASNQYLRIIAHCLKAVARRGSDTLARYGSAEFIALLPGTELAEATQIAEQLRNQIEKAQQASHPDTKALMTVSVGVSSCVPTVHPTPRERTDGAFHSVLYPAVLLSAADRALQRAKRNGCNQVDSQTCGEDNPHLTTVYQSQGKIPL